MVGWETWTDIIVPAVTMAATIVLAWFTFVLARATRRLARASSQPLVSAAIQPNIWSMMHSDLVVHNSGNAPAYDVVVEITPEPKQADSRGTSEPPLRNISILRPGQEMKSFYTDIGSVLDEEFKIKLSWKCHPKSRTRESVSYCHHLPRGISRLGAWSPEIEIAESLKRLREDWQHIARGQRKLKVDGYCKYDREDERQEIEQMRIDRRKTQQSHDD